MCLSPTLKVILLKGTHTGRSDLLSHVPTPLEKRQPGPYARTGRQRAGVQSPTHRLTPRCLSAAQRPPLFSKQGQGSGVTPLLSLHQAGLGSGSAPAAAASPEDPEASLWASPKAWPPGHPQHPVSPSPRKTRARPLAAEEDGSRPSTCSLAPVGKQPPSRPGPPQTPSPTLGATRGPDLGCPAGP